VGEIGMAAAEDAEILAFAEQHSRVVVILDADFHTLLARSGGAGPSVIRVRIEGLLAAGLADLPMKVLEICEEDSILPRDCTTWSTSRVQPRFSTCNFSNGRSRL
jgi:predicted nuclease of predicted toxin-antitoxin system